MGNKGFKGLGRRVESVMSFFRSFAMFTIPALRIDIGQRKCLFSLSYISKIKIEINFYTISQ